MKKKKSIRDIWSNIHLVDKYLILIMIFFLAYSIMTIYIPKAELEFIADIDVIVRTSIASIFGYFISSNFVKNKKNENKIEKTVSGYIQTITKQTDEEDFTTTNKIGFKYNDDNITENMESDMGETDLEIKEKLETTRNSTETQVLVVGTICIIAIIFLLITRFSVTTTSNDVAALSQLRDIICGSIGFLIGIPVGDE